MEKYYDCFYEEKEEKEEPENPDLNLIYNLSILSKKQLFIKMQKSNAFIKQIIQEDIKFCNKNVINYN